MSDAGMLLARRTQRKSRFGWRSGQCHPHHDFFWTESVLGWRQEHLCGEPGDRSRKIHQVDMEWGVSERSAVGSKRRTSHFFYSAHLRELLVSNCQSFIQTQTTFLHQRWFSPLKTQNLNYQIFYDGWMNNLKPPVLLTVFLDPWALTCRRCWLSCSVCPGCQTPPPPSRTLTMTRRSRRGSSVKIRPWTSSSWIFTTFSMVTCRTNFRAKWWLLHGKLVWYWTDLNSIYWFERSTIELKVK